MEAEKRNQCIFVLMINWSQTGNLSAQFSHCQMLNLIFSVSELFQLEPQCSKQLQAFLKQLFKNVVERETTIPALQTPLVQSSYTSALLVKSVRLLWLKAEHM